MKHQNGYTTSNGGSVRYTDGQFFDSAWFPVFIPMGQAEINRFFSGVEEAERKAQRRLTRNELIRLGRLVTTH